MTPHDITLRERVDELEDENMRLNMRIRELESHRSKLDCRYAGQFADFSGSHCPLDKPCERCSFERRISTLKADIADLLATDKPAAWRLYLGESRYEELKAKALEQTR